MNGNGILKARELVSCVITALLPANVDFMAQKPLIFPHKHKIQAQIKPNAIFWRKNLDTNEKLRILEINF
jgi:hypothetical protein